MSWLGFIRILGWKLRMGTGKRKPKHKQNTYHYIVLHEFTELVKK